MKENKDYFFSEKIILEPIGKELSEEEISEIDDFSGKEDFVNFYRVHNGVNFPYTAWFYPEDCYNIPPEDYPYMTIDFFFNIPTDRDDSNGGLNMESVKDMILLKYDNYEDFLLFHLPLVMDVASNIFWIDIQTGEIKYTDFQESTDPEDAFTVASSFKDFCKRITTNKNLDKDMAFLNRLQN